MFRASSRWQHWLPVTENMWSSIESVGPIRAECEDDPEGKHLTLCSLSLCVQFNKAGTFETVWQAKYYNYYKREHCQFGNKFSNIEYECKPNETRSLMWINKEVFNWARTSERPTSGHEFNRWCLPESVLSLFLISFITTKRIWGRRMWTNHGSIIDPSLALNRPSWAHNRPSWAHNRHIVDP